MMKKRLLSVLLLIAMVSGIFPYIISADVYRTEFPFTDVSRGSWYYDAALFCYANSVISGTSETVFDPHTGTTREQMMVVLAGFSEEDVKGFSQTPFTDVTPNAWYTDYVNWAYERNYTDGISEALFGIGKQLTRQEAVTLIYNYSISNSLSAPVNSDPGHYKDAELIAPWAQAAFSWASYHSVIKGDNNGMLNPRATVKRCELAVMIRAFMENILHGDCDHSYSAAVCTDISKCACGLINRLGEEHQFKTEDCAQGFECEKCGYTLAPSGHKYAKATCSTPMTCTVCGIEYGEPLGHSTEQGICAYCNVGIFSDPFSEFAYHMTHSAMAEGSMRYLCGEVTHSDGNTSRQYVRYDTDSGRAGIEIIFKFTGSIHWIRTLIEFSEFSNLYVAHSDYMAGDKLLCSASANIYASYINKDQYVELLSYNGAPEYKNTMRSLVKNSVLLSIDSSNRLLSQIGMTVADMGFTKFY